MNMKDRIELAAKYLKNQGYNDIEYDRCTAYGGMTFYFFATKGKHKAKATVKEEKQGYSFSAEVVEDSQETENELPVFSYGTLMTGFGNHQRYLSGKTTSSVQAHIQGVIHSVSEAFPALFESDEKNHVLGELHYIKPEIYVEVLKSLDRLEGYNEKDKLRSMYIRRQEKVTDESENEITAWVYYWNSNISQGLKKVKSGDWREHKKPKKILTKDQKEFEQLWDMNTKF